MFRFVSAALLVVACGGPKSTEPPKPMVWKDMTFDQKKKFMKDVVMPKAKEVFTAFDAKFAKMDCKTCHGPGVDSGKFEMPNPKLKPLPNTPELFQAMMAKDEDFKKFTPFMAEKVEPMMADLLHMTPFDPTTMTGEFSCAACHQLVDGEGKVVPPPKPAAAPAAAPAAHDAGH